MCKANGVRFMLLFLAGAIYAGPALFCLGCKGRAISGEGLNPEDPTFMEGAIRLEGPLPEPVEMSYTDP
jgi:hypothetical protein